VLYTGDVDPREKQAAVDAFNNDPGVRVFLSSDAGGAGVNLPAGNFHINFNLPFSAGQLAQRNARLDRISSQHQRLTILNILTAGTIETFYREILRRRQILAEAVLDQRANGAARPPKRSVDMDLGSLRAFLLDM
jgi:SNF2 family DNA or RNA helicase